MAQGAKKYKRATNKRSQCTNNKMGQITRATTSIWDCLHKPAAILAKALTSDKPLMPAIR